MVLSLSGGALRLPPSQPANTLTLMAESMMSDSRRILHRKQEGWRFVHRFDSAGWPALGNLRTFMPLTNPSHRRDHMLNLFSAHAREDRQTNQSLPQPRRHRKVFRAKPKCLLVVGMQMQWPPVDGTSHPSLFEFHDKLIAAYRQPVQTQLDRK